MSINQCILELSPLQSIHAVLPLILAKHMYFRPLVTCCQCIWCLKNCLGLGSLTQMDVPKHINALIFMSNAFSKARLINFCKSIKCFYKNVLQKLIWCKSQRCIHFQATLLLAIASVAAIISSVFHSSEVFEPFAVFVCVLCLCVEREIPRGWDNGFLVWWGNTQTMLWHYKSHLLGEKIKLCLCQPAAALPTSGWSQ